MTNAIDASVTLDDVFSVVTGKRVPLAPELAGYLALEIAEAAGAGAGEIDPKSVYVGEEGSVAIVRKGGTGDAETSIRGLLGRLLEASGSQTSAVAAVAKRKTAGGVSALVEELEAALIPVNRSAGRRALARLAREVKRVTQGVGRNASAAPPPMRAPVARGDAPPSPRLPRVPDRQILDEEDAAVTLARDPGAKPSPPPPRPPLAPPLAAPAPRARLPGPGPAAGALPKMPSPSPSPGAAATGVQSTFLETPPSRQGPKLFARSEVDSLLDTFEVSDNDGDKAVARELKAMVGLDPTPPPPDAEAIEKLSPHKPTAAAASAAPADDPVAALLAMTESPSSTEPGSPPARAPAPAPIPAAPPRHADPVDALLAATAAHSAPPPPMPGRPAAQAPSPQPPPAAPAPPPHQPPGPFARSAAPAAAPPPPSAPGSGPRLPAAPDSRRAPTARIPSPDRSTPKKKSGSSAGMVLVLVALLALAAGAAAIWKLKPGLLTGRTPENVALERASAEVARQQALQAAQQKSCRVTLIVSEIPSNAEVLLRMGQSPVDVPRMPVGARLEFVATAEGFAPKRGVVPAAQAWDPGPDGKPRYSLAIQLDKSTAKAGSLDPWPVGEPGTEVGGRGAPGTVQVIANPKGAEIWLLAGVGPEARIEQLPCEQDYEVLLANQSLRKRLAVTAKDIAERAEAPAGTEGAGTKLVKLSAATTDAAPTHSASAKP
jgi:hypothetical protein